MLDHSYTDFINPRGLITFQRLFIFYDYFPIRDITYNINLLLHTILTLLTPLMLVTILELLTILVSLASKLKKKRNNKE